MMRALLVVAALATAGLPDAAAAGVPSFVRGASWIEVATPEFTLVTDAPPAVRQDVVRLVQRFSGVLRALHPELRLRTAEPTWIYLFRDAAEMEHYRPATIENIQACFIRTERGNVMILSGRLEGERREEPILHEFVHLFLHANFAQVPGWLDEGLAQYYETCRFSANAAEVGRPDAMLDWMRAHEPVNLDLLFAIDAKAPAYREDGALRPVFYSQSLALVHLLQSTPERAAGFARFLERLRAGTSARLAFRASFPESTWAGLESELRPYAKKAGFVPTRRVPLSDAAAGAGASERPLTAAEALVRLGELALELSDQQRPFAADHFLAALALDPALAGAEAGLGMIEDLNGHPAAAERHYRAALSGTLTGGAVLAAAGRGTLHRMRLAARRQAPRDSIQAIARVAYGRFRLALDLEPDHFGAAAGCAFSTMALQIRPDTALVGTLARMEAITPGRPDVSVAVATLSEWARPAGDRGPGGAANDDLAAAVIGQLDSMNAAGDLMQAGRAREARALYERIRDRAPAGSRAREQAADAIVRVDAYLRLARAADLIEKGRFAEAAPLISGDQDWPDEAYRDQAASLWNYVTAQRAIDRAYGMIRAGRLADARVTLQTALTLDISEKMKAFIRERIRQVDAAQSKR